MSQQTIGIGTVANDGTGDPLRTAFDKANQNFTEVYRSSILPGYVAGNWYVPDGYGGAASAGSAPGANVIRLVPGYLLQKCTLNSLGVRLSTAAASGNLQLAIYAHNASTAKPTGTALASTASISTTSVGSLNSAVSVQLNPGLYWWASNYDNATAVAVAVNNIGPCLGAIFGGSSTQAETLTAVACLVGWSTPQTFGTWPDITSAVFTKQSGSDNAAVQFKVASVP